MAEYLIQDTTLDAIADAINAKTGGSSAMTPAEMVTAIESISGGGSLPSVISKIDGGSFTFASDTAIQANKITHSLGEKPKGYIIWSESVMQTSDGFTNQCLMFSYGIGLPWNNSGTLNTAGYSYTMWRRTSGGVQENNSGFPTITTTEIAPVGFYYWAGGATYKWLAWA